MSEQAVDAYLDQIDAYDRLDRERLEPPPPEEPEWFAEYMEEASDDAV